MAEKGGAAVAAASASVLIGPDASSMASSVKDRLGNDVKAAMKASDKVRLGTLRLILAAIKQYEVDERRDADDAICTDLLTKMAKQRRESIAQYTQGGRQALADREETELGIIAEYLPAQLSEAEIAAAVDAAIASTGAAGPKDMGKVMGRLGGELKGRADMAAVSALVRTRLNA